MSTCFTDGKPRIATEADCKTAWGGHPNGARFRCYLCGHKFRPGDQWRWQYGSGRSVLAPDGRTLGVMNFLVCKDCDGPDVLDRWVERNVEFMSGKFWALR